MQWCSIYLVDGTVLEGRCVSYGAFSFVLKTRKEGRFADRPTWRNVKIPADEIVNVLWGL